MKFEIGKSYVTVVGFVAKILGIIDNHLYGAVKCNDTWRPAVWTIKGKNHACGLNLMEEYSEWQPPDLNSKLKDLPIKARFSQTLNQPKEFWTKGYLIGITPNNNFVSQTYIPWNYCEVYVGE